MIPDPYINAIALFVSTVLGGMLGWYIANLGESREPGKGRKDFSKPTSDTEQQQLFVNAGVLYATIILVVGSVVSDWPPEGQQFPGLFDDLVFFGSVLVTAAIFVRVSLLIYRVETENRLS